MPRRKPASARQNRETRDIGLVRQQTGKVPECPPMADGTAMLPATREAWAAFWASDVAGLVVDADVPALGRLFGLYDLRDRMMRAYLSEPFAAGSTGQLKIHPAGTEVASLDARILQLEDRFGITPAGRLKLGIVLGAAAKSLEDLNASFLDDGDDDGDGTEDVDPRQPLRVVIDATATG